MTLYKTENYGLGLFKIVLVVSALGTEGIDNGGVKHLTGLIYYRELTAVAVTGVVAKNYLALAEEILQRKDQE